VGAGAGGGVVAKVLAEAGLSVVLLERGRWQSFEDTTTTSCGRSAPPCWQRYGRTTPPRRVVEHPNGSTRIGATRADIATRACVGSGTLS
jgi:choline dehydrogenase-like flavoprotein